MSRKIVLSNIKGLYDGSSSTSSALHSKVDLIIDGPVIAELRNHSNDLKDSSELKIIDASDLYVTPGLIDCHSHITLNGLDSESLSEMNGPAGLVYVEKILYKTLVDGGVTSLRDMGGATHMIKRMVGSGLIIGPRIKIAICMLSATGGNADLGSLDRCHGEVSKLFPPQPGRPSSIVDGPWECRKRVREIASLGADFIKLCAGKSLALGTAAGKGSDSTDFTYEEMRAICDEAKERGLSVASHAHLARGVQMSIEAGVKDLQHITYMGANEVALASKFDCSVTPTSWVTHEVCKRSTSENVRNSSPQILESHRKAVALAKNAGLRILAGTDPVLAGMHGKNYLELSHLIQEGLTSLEAWYAATGQAADAIGFLNTGRISKGRVADLLIADTNISEDPSRVGTSLIEVIKDGFGHKGRLQDFPQATFSQTLKFIK